ncbi:hypothetical protein F4810DRAFT_143196 [Camillea tinctor]|nr:hypothetical protein F4810DRAFT_143196 [Camillea tinctor]
MGICGFVLPSLIQRLLCSSPLPLSLCLSFSYYGLMLGHLFKQRSCFFFSFFFFYYRVLRSSDLKSAKLSFLHAHLPRIQTARQKYLKCRQSIKPSVRSIGLVLLVTRARIIARKMQKRTGSQGSGVAIPTWLAWKRTQISCAITPVDGIISQRLGSLLVLHELTGRYCWC